MLGEAAIHVRDYHPSSRGAGTFTSLWPSPRPAPSARRASSASERNEPPGAESAEAPEGWRQAAQSENVGERRTRSQSLARTEVLARCRREIRPPTLREVQNPGKGWRARTDLGERDSRKGTRLFAMHWSSSDVIDGELLSVEHVRPLPRASGGVLGGGCGQR